MPDWNYLGERSKPVNDACAREECGHTRADERAVTISQLMVVKQRV